MVRVTFYVLDTIDNGFLNGTQSPLCDIYHSVKSSYRRVSVFVHRMYKVLH